MNHSAFGWYNHPGYINPDYSDGKWFGSLTSLNPYADEWSPPPDVSGTYSGEVFGYLARDSERTNRINGTVTMEYRHAAERLDMKFRFPGNEYYTEDFNSVEFRNDCGTQANPDRCFLGWNILSFRPYGPDGTLRKSALVGGLFYGPESQEFGGWFWKHGPDLERTLEAAFGATRQ